MHGVVDGLNWDASKYYTCILRMLLAAGPGFGLGTFGLFIEKPDLGIVGFNMTQFSDKNKLRFRQQI